MIQRPILAAMGWAALALLTAAAAPAPPQPPYEAAPADDPDGVGITWNDPDDPRMTAARDRARAELPAFFEHMANPAADESHFHVKFDLGGTGEFIWADELQRSGTTLTGRLINTPLHEAYSYGQRVEIPESAIVDWGFVRGRQMQGNYTTRVQLELMSPEEARQVRAAFGW